MFRPAPPPPLSFSRLGIAVAANAYLNHTGQNPILSTSASRLADIRGSLIRRVQFLRPDQNRPDYYQTSNLLEHELQLRYISALIVYICLAVDP